MFKKQKTKPFYCYHCNSVVVSLSSNESSKFSGLNFRCECCGKENYLHKNSFLKGTSTNDPYLNIYSVDQYILSLSE